MIKRLFSLTALVLLVASCVNDVDSVNPFHERGNAKSEFYATIEAGSDAGTKVFADSQMRVLWNANDLISIFNKTVDNLKFQFTGEDGDNAGGFDPVSGSATGTEIDHIYAVYPYSEGTAISAGGVLSLTLPAAQTYKEKSFGIGANTMVSVTDDNHLQFKNVGGYLSFRFYGDGVSVKSITLKSNNGEKLAGPAKVTMPVGDTPTAVMQDGATESITLTCETPVALGADTDHCTEFWFVVPPTTFSQGFTITLTDDRGAVFEKTTSRSITISRNTLKRMSPMEVKTSILTYFSATMAAREPVTKLVDPQGKTSWEMNEKIAIYYEKTDGTYGKATANVDAVSAEGEASISAVLADAKDGGAVKFIYPASIVNEKGDDIDASKLADQHGTIQDISDNFDIAKGSSTLKIEGTTSGTTDKVSMENQVLICLFKPECGGAAIDGIESFTVSDGTNTYTVTPEPPATSFGTGGIYVAMLPVTDKEITITAETATKSYYYSESGVTLEVGKFYDNFDITMMVKFDLSTASGTVDEDAYLYQSDPTTPITTTITIADGKKVVIEGLNVKTENTNAIVCQGDAEIVLKGSNTVTAESLPNAEINSAVIKPGTYEPRTTLVISGDGELIARPIYNSTYSGAPTVDNAAVIGADFEGDCGDILITGGTITVADNYAAAIGAGRANNKDSRCGTITIAGGTVTASSGAGAGIGSGAHITKGEGTSYCEGVVISGGTVIARSIDGAAIGSGKEPGSANLYNYHAYCGFILITGGTVDAQTTLSGMNDYAGAAIGGGYNSVVGTITISGGEVTAKAGSRSAGIGAGGYGSRCGAILIDGGKVDATGGKEGAGIGTGNGKAANNRSTCESITITSGVTRVKATKGSDSSYSYSIGVGKSGNYTQCGTVKVGDATGQISTSPFTYPSEP